MVENTKPDPTLDPEFMDSATKSIRTLALGPSFYTILDAIIPEIPDLPPLAREGVIMAVGLRAAKCMKGRKDITGVAFRVKGTEITFDMETAE